mmetsp:Transcript_27762/g.89390  ORF Transcript_27762/g.89390 Transcript_27762/m.89390 type:complete len:305 (-) Transcript_27762:5658-6572(-)
MCSHTLAPTACTTPCPAQSTALCPVCTRPRHTSGCSNSLPFTRSAQVGSSSARTHSLGACSYHAHAFMCTVSSPARISSRFRSQLALAPVHSGSDARKGKRAEVQLTSSATVSCVMRMSIVTSSCSAGTVSRVSSSVISRARTSGASSSARPASVMLWPSMGARKAAAWRTDSDWASSVDHILGSAAPWHGGWPLGVTSTPVCTVASRTRNCDAVSSPGAAIMRTTARTSSDDTSRPRVPSTVAAARAQHTSSVPLSTAPELAPLRHTARMCAAVTVHRTSAPMPWSAPRSSSVDVDRALRCSR